MGRSKPSDSGRSRCCRWRRFTFDGYGEQADGRDWANGEGTRSATPLAWTHAQFVRLAWSIQAGQPIERPSIVACRYQKQLCP